MKVPITIGMCLVWLLAAAAGILIFVNYESRAGQVGETPKHWPEKMSIALDAKHDTLLMFVHPQCPCTRASMEELNRLLAKSGGQAVAHLVFMKPDNFPTNWTRTELWNSAAAIPGVSLHEDLDGALAKKFGAETSGYVVLYNPQGQLIFRGGITSGRGHIGDNPGESSIVMLLGGRDPAMKQTPVYGCSLMGQTCSAICPQTVTMK